MHPTLHKLYQRARAGCPRALEEVLNTASRQLNSWLFRHVIVSIQSWERREIAEAGVVAALLRIGTIPTWPQAWCYARKTAIGLAQRSAQTAQIQPGSWTAREPAVLDELDSCITDSSNSTELADIIEQLESQLETRSAQSLLVLISVISGCPSLRTLARRLGVSVRTARRRQRAMREWFRRQLMDDGHRERR